MSELRRVELSRATEDLSAPAGAVYLTAQGYPPRLASPACLKRWLPAGTLEAVVFSRETGFN